MVSTRFYDLNVHTAPEGKNTIEEMAATAKHFGYAGVAFTNSFDSCKPVRSTVVDGLEIFSGVELKTENASKLHGFVGKFRQMVDIIVVRGGSESINRAAVENSNVDILSNFGSMKDNGLNHVLAKSASDNDVAISFDLSHVIGLRGGRRVKALSNFRKDLKLVRKYDVPFVLTSNAVSLYDMRAPRELIALASLFGMTREEALHGISVVPEMILARNRPSGGHVFEGVEIVDLPSDDGDVQ